MCQKISYRTLTNFITHFEKLNQQVKQFLRLFREKKIKKICNTYIKVFPTFINLKNDRIWKQKTTMSVYDTSAVVSLKCRCGLQHF